jgi:hypothetical protein
MDLTKKIYFAHEIGTVSDGGTEYIDFALKIPVGYKTLKSISLFSPEMITGSSDVRNIELGMWVNNKKTPVGNWHFVLGYHDLDDHRKRTIDVNQNIMPNNEITGFIKYLAGTGDITVRLILEFEIE